MFSGFSVLHNTCTTTRVNCQILIHCRLSILGSRSDSMDLPVLDLSRYSQGTPSEQRKFSGELLRVFKAHAFVKLKNHGMDREYIDTLMRWVGRLAS